MMRAEDVRAALTKKFAAPEYALFFEVGDATGGRARRWADALAMGLWPSRGLALQGFEIKVSRSDLTSELKNPAKAESIARYCRYWWLATPPGLVREGELPEGWGLYEAHANGLRCVKQAPALAEEPVTPSFLAAILRRASETDRKIESAALATAMDRDEQRTRERITAEVDRRTYDLTSRTKTAEDKLKAIYDACGLEPHEVSRLFGDGRFAAAVGMVHRLGIAKACGGVHDLARTMRPLLAAIDGMAPADMKRAANPIGPHNDYVTMQALDSEALLGGEVVCGWGAHGGHRGRDAAAVAPARRADVRLACLDTISSGAPKHPLYIAHAVKPRPWAPTEEAAR